jgi:hypothetical protein
MYFESGLRGFAVSCGIGKEERDLDSGDFRGLSKSILGNSEG